jgi:hypothetical protein
VLNNEKRRGLADGERIRTVIPSQIFGPPSRSHANGVGGVFLTRYLFIRQAGRENSKRIRLSGGNDAARQECEMYEIEVEFAAEIEDNQLPANQVLSVPELIDDGH